MNRIVLIGRLVKDPELRYTADGTPVASFRLAVDRQGKNSETDFIDIVAWRQSAEFASQYLGKGRQVAVDGRLQIREWQDKDGNKRRTAEVVAESVQALDRAKGDAPVTEELMDSLDQPTEDPFMEE